jgi:streptogramin lyase
MTRSPILRRRVAVALLLLPIVPAACASSVPPPTGPPSAVPSPVATQVAAQATVPSPSIAAPAAGASAAGALTEPLSLPASSVSLADTPTLADWTLAHQISAPGSGQITFADGWLWVVNRKDAGFTGSKPNGEIYRIEPGSGNIDATIEHARGGFPTHGEGAIWLVNAEFGQTVTRVDLKTLKAVRFRSSDTEDPVPEAIAVAGGFVWVGNNHDGTVAQIDPASLKVRKTIRLTEPGGFGVRGKAATDGTSVWFGVSRTGEIVRIDAATATEVSRIRLPQVPHEHLPAGLSQSDASVPEQLVVVGHRLYASTVEHVYAIDVSAVGAERIVTDFLDPSTDYATVLAAGESGDVWALVHGPVALVRIDGATSTLLGRLPLNVLDLEAGEMVAGDGSVFIRVPDGVLEVSRGA